MSKYAVGAGNMSQIIDAVNHCLRLCILVVLVLGSLASLSVTNTCQIRALEGVEMYMEECENGKWMDVSSMG